MIASLLRSFPIAIRHGDIATQFSGKVMTAMQLCSKGLTATQFSGKVMTATQL